MWKSRYDPGRELAKALLEEYKEKRRRETYIAYQGSVVISKEEVERNNNDPVKLVELAKVKCDHLFYAFEDLLDPTEDA